jgi:uncharacterized protein (TIGR00661 family)
MKILYAIQGTGNGHLSRARDIIPILKADHDVDILVSGTQVDVELPYEIRYKFHGLGFVFGKAGGIDLLATFRKAKLKSFLNEINDLPVHLYDLVINDFEPVSAWACYQMDKPCISLSHQAAVLNKHTAKPRKKDLVGRAVLKNYAPCTVQYGFHFEAYDKDIFTPVIRKQVREHTITNMGHYTVYLPSYSDKRILTVLRKCRKAEWQVFSKHNQKVYKEKNITIQPINNQDFVESMASCEGVLCGAGFETPAEALFMKKKLLVIPMKGQYEQQCNAAALEKMGVSVIKSLKKKHIKTINNWMLGDKIIPVNYPDDTAKIVRRLLDAHLPVSPHGAQPIKKMYTAKKFSTRMFKKLRAYL